MPNVYDIRILYEYTAGDVPLFDLIFYRTRVGAHDPNFFYRRQNNSRMKSPIFIKPKVGARGPIFHSDFSSTIKKSRTVFAGH